MAKKKVQGEGNPAFVGVAVLYSYLQKKAEEAGTPSPAAGLVLGEELTSQEKVDLPQDLQDVIAGLGGAQCFWVMKKG